MKPGVMPGMIPIRASAPGKLLLIGEYAVLDGAPALVMAVDRRVLVRIDPAGDRPGRLNAPQLGIREAPMRIRGERLHCDGFNAAALGLTSRLVPAVLQTLGRAPEAIETVDIEIDSGALFESDGGRPVKLGLGSSAAVCASIAVALSEWFGDSGTGSGPVSDSGSDGASDTTSDTTYDRTFESATAALNRLERWLPVYRRALGSRASGADLAAAMLGGFSRFRSTGAVIDCRPLDWPDGLYWRAVWTGQAAQTTDFVGAYDAWKQNNPDAAAGFHARLSEIALSASANAGNGAVLFEASRDYAQAMTALGEAAGIDIVTAAHRRLAEFGGRCGVIYKSCGAGGGDLGIALALDPAALREFEAGISDCGGVPLNLSISGSGAEVMLPRVPESGEGNQ